jgi:hypothetical protein
MKTARALQDFAVTALMSRNFAVKHVISVPVSTSSPWQMINVFMINTTDTLFVDTFYTKLEF